MNRVYEVWVGIAGACQPMSHGTNGCGCSYTSKILLMMETMVICKSRVPAKSAVQHPPPPSSSATFLSFTILSSTFRRLNLLSLSRKA
ncbi:hypothetical protein AAHA92_31791 [Salvia divinorum]|uniref:Uncharacterized protein n=1 Tax=Salvia divinorum TaxID=28513 RepID=A0ABD1FJ48_SALDI